MQKFFESSLKSNYIKYLLLNTPIPMIPTIQTDDYILKGETYIYKFYIIKCIQSGVFEGDKTLDFTDDYLYVNEDTVVTNEDYVLARYNPETGKFDTYYKDEIGIGGLTVTDDFVRVYKLPRAKYKLIGNFNYGMNILNVTSVYNSNVNYYDTNTHEKLGNYLRYVRDMKGVDLMCLYNCFSYRFTDSITLTTDSIGYSEYFNNDYKVTLVPVKYNKTYTIGINSDFPIFIKPIIFNDSNMVKDYRTGKSLTQLLNYPTQTYNSLKILEPITIRISNTPKDGTTKEEQDILLLQKYEKYLYVAIQIPANNDSQIVVLEGDYTNTTASPICSAQGVQQLPPYKLSELFSPIPSLLHGTGKDQVPFSDKLIPYLLSFTIDSREYIDENVEMVENKIGYKPKIKNFAPGIWDNNLRYALYYNYNLLNNAQLFPTKDIIGYVDCDVENAIDTGYLKIRTPQQRGLQSFEG